MNELMAYWLMKSEPDAYSIDQFQKEKKALWDGIRNFQARNFMTQEMKLGDEFIFYHSNAKPPGAIGIGRISAPAVEDPTQFQKRSKYYDKRSTKEKPLWFCVECEFVEKFPRLVGLPEIKENKKLAKMELLKKGNRLSIQKVSKAQFDEIKKQAYLEK